MIFFISFSSFLPPMMERGKVGIHCGFIDDTVRSLIIRSSAPLATLERSAYFNPVRPSNNISSPPSYPTSFEKHNPKNTTKIQLVTNKPITTEKDEFCKTLEVVEVKHKKCSFTKELNGSQWQSRLRNVKRVHCNKNQKYNQTETKRRCGSEPITVQAVYMKDKSLEEEKALVKEKEWEDKALQEDKSLTEGVEEKEKEKKCSFTKEQNGSQWQSRLRNIKRVDYCQLMNRKQKRVNIRANKLITTKDKKISIKERKKRLLAKQLNSYNLVDTVRQAPPELEGQCKLMQLCTEGSKEILLQKLLQHKKTNPDHTPTLAELKQRASALKPPELFEDTITYEILSHQLYQRFIRHSASQLKQICVTLFLGFHSASKYIMATQLSGYHVDETDRAAQEDPPEDIQEKCLEQRPNHFSSWSEEETISAEGLLSLKKRKTQWNTSTTTPRKKQAVSLPQEEEFVLIKELIDNDESKEYYKEVRKSKRQRNQTQTEGALPQEWADLYYGEEFGLVRD